MSDPIDFMAHALIEQGADLGDDRSCILALLAAGISAREIDDAYERALDRARALAEYLREPA
jgi:hypothetical protein